VTYPAPMILALAFNCSGIPGPPLGPSYRTTHTTFSPRGIAPLFNDASNSTSLSNTNAFPVNRVPSLPVILAT